MFIQILIELLQANSKALIRRHFLAASDLVLHCLPMSHKKDTRHIIIMGYDNVSYGLQNE